MPQNQLVEVYVCLGKGTAANPPPNAGSIQRYRLSLPDGTLTPGSFVSEPPAAWYLVAQPGGRTLYAVHDLSEVGGYPGGGVSAFGIESLSSTLSLRSLQPVHGMLPCYVTFDPTGRWLLAANYGTGNVVALPILEDGSIGEACDIVQHHGASVNPQRQEGPHTHSVVLDPTGGYALVADLGLDKIIIYRLEMADNTLKLRHAGEVTTRPGSGPRHLAYHPNGHYLYCTNELDSTLTVFAGDASQGTLREVQTVSMLPERFSGQNYPAHLQLFGDTLYASNRGHDSIVLFAVEADGEKLRPVSYVSTEGSSPRHFAIDPTGQVMLVGNEKSDSLAVFRRDPVTGGLSLIALTDAPNPVFILFRQPAAV
jgi:6-phosphogluconolactonase